MTNECRDPFYEMCENRAIFRLSRFTIDVMCNLPKHRPHDIHTDGYTSWRVKDGEAVREEADD